MPQANNLAMSGVPCLLQFLYAYFWALQVIQFIGLDLTISEYSKQVSVSWFSISPPMWALFNYETTVLNKYTGEIVTRSIII